MIKNIIKHIDHFLKLGGENHIGLGSDFDGVSYLPSGIRGVESMKDIITAMKNHGYSNKIIENICFNNFFHILYKILGKRL